MNNIKKVGSISMWNLQEKAHSYECADVSAKKFITLY
jgi:hypothetical protein